MEKWPWPKQFELWPKPMSPEEMDAELSKKETTEALEEEGARHARILSPEESARRAGDLVKKMEWEDKGKKTRGEDKKKE